MEVHPTDNRSLELRTETDVGRGTPPKQTRWKSFLLGVFVAVLTASLLAVGGHLWARCKDLGLLVFSYRLDLSRIMQADPDTFWSLRPNLKGELFAPQPNGPPNGFRVSTNELGLRNPPIAEKGNRFRILAIGDSTTFGQYVEDNEAWPAQLQSMLDPDARRIEVINAGLIGATSFQGLCYCSKRGFALKPDAIVATYGFNDRGVWTLSDRVNLTPNARFGIESLFLPLLWKWAPTYEKEVKSHPRVSPGEYLDILVTLADLCKERSIRLYFVLWPIPSQLTGDPDFLCTGPGKPYQSIMLEAGIRTQTPIIDLRRPLHDAPQPVLLDIVHANPAGCRIAAECVAAALRTYSPEAFRMEHAAKP